MKKTLLFTFLALLTLPAISQGKKYDRAMSSAVEDMHKASDPVAELETTADFEKITQDYPDQWLPAYHAARILITSSFSGTESDKKEAMLDHAKVLLDKAENLAPEESEVKVLKALYFIGLISIEPDIRGPIYYQDAMDAIQEGLDLNRENPRASYLSAMWTLNMPDFMGGGPDAAKPIFLEARQKYQSYKNEDPFWPVWGSDLVETELDRMGE